MRRRRLSETARFALTLALLLAGFLWESLFCGRVLSPADVLLVQASFRPEQAAAYEPLNRLLMDPVLQFQPWLEFNRAMIRQGRLPLWNPHAGCGAPHLANGQSAVFDPFNAIAYLAEVPTALGWMAFGRLWTAGIGMFLLARAWGLGPWGRWFSGLVFPFSGFLVVWLLYPVTPVAIWLPWLFLATDRAIARPGGRGAGLLAVAVALVIAGGHIQTSAHVLIAGGLLAAWRIGSGAAPWRERLPGATCWLAGQALGLTIAAIQIVPLWVYLSESPVWEDRHLETGRWWTLSRPRILEAACTALPYAYGSQRRGHPNLARALRVNNLNESAGGYAGLATLIWLVPLGIKGRRRHPEVRFLAVLVLFAALGAFRLPPVDNLLRALPVLDVTDNRRLVLWVAFGLSLLGGAGIDALSRGERLPRRWVMSWFAAALALGAAALLLPRLEPRMRQMAERRVRETSAGAADQAADVAHLRVERQVEAAVTFLPRYYGAVAAELMILGALALGLRGGSPRAGPVAPVLLGLTMIELFAFGYGLNPAIPRALQEREPPVVVRLRERLGAQGRALGIGEELPPNVLMRFGLGDPRNYDSVELTRSLDWFAPLFEAGGGAEARTSRREVTWEGVRRARARLERAGVGAVVAASPPPVGWAGEVERHGEVWIAWLSPDPWADSASGGAAGASRGAGSAAIRVRAAAARDRILVRETWDAGWRARLDGGPARPEPSSEGFIQIDILHGDHVIELEYRPMWVTVAGSASLSGLAGAILALTGWARCLIGGIAKTGLGRNQTPRLELTS